jgi:hypothetical protein
VIHFGKNFRMNDVAQSKRHGVTLPEGFIFTVCMACVGWAGNILIQSIAHSDSAAVQKDARDRELDNLTARFNQLEGYVYERGCGHER